LCLLGEESKWHTMEKHIVKIESIDQVTHDVIRIIVGRPIAYNFASGQATEIAINKNGWQEEKRPFTFTNLPGDNYLEFNIKTYPKKKGVTNELLKLVPGDELILHEVFGAISYKGEGTFIAGGAGVTPFISIFRSLQAKDAIGGNVLIFANKTKNDIILEEEFTALLGGAFINILSDEKLEGYPHGKITTDFLKSNIRNPNGHFYICGPPPMIEEVKKQLKSLGIHENAVTVEL
jgi:ferredoxin-NADP reductase